jgi:hypothetical protein
VVRAVVDWWSIGGRLGRAGGRSIPPLASPERRDRQSLPRLSTAARRLTSIPETVGATFGRPLEPVRRAAIARAIAGDPAIVRPRCDVAFDHRRVDVRAISIGAATAVDPDSVATERDDGSMRVLFSRKLYEPTCMIFGTRRRAHLVAVGVTPLCYRLIAL